MMLRLLRLVCVWALTVVMVVAGRAQHLSTNPFLVFSHVIQGLDPAGPARLFSDEDDHDDETEFEEYLDDEDNPFSFLG